jgi:hypothetical protein
MSTTSSADRELAWRKASRSAGNGECIEIAVAARKIHVRDSKNPDGGFLVCSPEMFTSFLSAVKMDVLRQGLH